MITNKQQLSALARAIHYDVTEKGNSVKLGRMREAVAQALGCNSVNDALSKLPLTIHPLFHQLLSVILKDCHNINWITALWLVPWPEEIVFSETEISFIWDSAFRGCPFLDSGYPPPRMRPDGSGGWYIGKPNGGKGTDLSIAQLVLRDVQDDPNDLFNPNTMLSEDDMATLKSKLKPLTFTYWDSKMAHEVRWIIGGFIDDELYDEQGKRFDLSGMLNKPVKEVANLALTTIGNNPLMRNVHSNPLMPVVDEMKKENTALSGAIEKRYVDGVVGHCILNEMFKSVFDYQHDLWGVLAGYQKPSEPIARAGAFRDGDLYGFYRPFLWSPNFRSLIGELALQWLSLHDDWNGTLRSLMVNTPEYLPSDTSMAVIDGRVSGVKKVAKDFIDGKKLVIERGAYRADENPFYENYEDEYRELGYIDDEGERAEESCIEDEYYEEDDIWDIPFVFPFEAQNIGIQIHNSENGKILCNIGIDYLINDYYDKGFGSYWYSIMDEMSADFSLISGFLRDNPECYTQPHVVQIYQFKISTQVSYEEAVKAITQELNGTSNYQVLIHPNALLSNYAGKSFRGAKKLAEEYAVVKQKIVNAFDKDGINAYWL